jgi:hypothetical protein
MSTRSVIARPWGKGFRGRYHHWDGYPSGLGAELYALAQPDGPFGGDTQKMLKVLIDEHPGGWSTINGADWSKKPGFEEPNSDRIAGPCQFVKSYKDSTICGLPSSRHLCQDPKNQHVKRHLDKYPCGTSYAEHLGHTHVSLRMEPEASAPQCYCHGERSEKGWLCTDKSASGSGCEYAYVIKGRKMTVLSSYTDIGSEDGTKSQKMIGFFGMGDKSAEWRPIGWVDFDEPEPDWNKMQGWE